MSKLDVLYISNEAGIGGAMQSMVDMLVGLRKVVRPVVILPAEGSGEVLLQERGIDYYVIPFRMAYGKIGARTQTAADEIFADNYEAAVRLAEIIDEKEIRLVHTNSIVVNVGAMAALMRGVPHIWHIRELLEEDFESELYDKEWACRLFAQSDEFISISECVRESYAEKYGLHSVRLYDGFDIKRYKRDIYEGTDKSSIFLLAGSMNPGKGHWDAVHAMEILVENKNTEIRLLMAGNGNRKYIWGLENYIRKKGLQKYICLLPAQKDLSVLRKKCRFSLTTSKMEALGRVTIEAMLGGNIVIGANTGGTAEILGRLHEKGYLYQQGDPVDLAFAMKAAAGQSAEDALHMRKKAQEFALSAFDTEKYAEKILQLYEEALCRCRKKACKELLQDMEHRYNQISEKKRTTEKGKRKTADDWRKEAFLLERWLRLKQRGISLGGYLRKNGMKQVAVYGMGYLGCCLYDELENEGITISYAIDRDSHYLSDLINIKRPEDDLKAVDAVIVTVLKEEEELKAYLEVKCPYKIVQLSALMNELEVDGALEALGKI